MQPAFFLQLDGRLQHLRMFKTRPAGRSRRENQKSIKNATASKFSTLLLASSASSSVSSSSRSSASAFSDVPGPTDEVRTG